jgi:hypothetical protein
MLEAEPKRGSEGNGEKKIKNNKQSVIRLTEEDRDQPV